MAALQHLSGSPNAAAGLCAFLLCFTPLSCSSHEEEHGPVIVPGLDSTFPIAVCADADLVTIRTIGFNGRDLQSMGTVTEVGTGLDTQSWGCRLGLGRRSNRSQDPPQQVTWFRIRPIMRGEITLVLAAPGFAPKIQPGDVIRVAARSEPEEPGNPDGGSQSWQVKGWFELRDENKQLLFWYGAADSVAELKTPEEVHLSEGEPQAFPSRGCGHWEQKQLAAEVAGVSASIGWTEQAAVGDWMITNSGVSVSVTPPTCYEYAPTGAAAAIWALSLIANP